MDLKDKDMNRWVTTILVVIHTILYIVYSSFKIKQQKNLIFFCCFQEIMKRRQVFELNQNVYNLVSEWLTDYPLLSSSLHFRPKHKRCKCMHWISKPKGPLTLNTFFHFFFAIITYSPSKPNTNKTWVVGSNPW